MAKREKQPRCPSTDERMHKLGYIHIIDIYSALKRKDILTHATLEMNVFEDTILRGASQSQMDKYCGVHFQGSPRAVNSIETESRRAVNRGRGRRGRGVFNVYSASIRGKAK